MLRIKRLEQRNFGDCEMVLPSMNAANEASFIIFMVASAIIVTVPHVKTLTPLIGSTAGWKDNCRDIIYGVARCNTILIFITSLRVVLLTKMTAFGIVPGSIFIFRQKHYCYVECGLLSLDRAVP
jgi:nicotinamide riboside transporter PnuC